MLVKVNKDEDLFEHDYEGSTESIIEGYTRVWSHLWGLVLHARWEGRVDPSLK